MWIELILIAVIGAFFYVVHTVWHLGEAPSFENKQSKVEKPAFQDRILYYALRRKQNQLNEQEVEIDYQSRSLELKIVEVEQLYKEKSFDQREKGLALGQISIDLQGKALEIEAQKQEVIKEQLVAQTKKQEVTQERLNLGSDKLQIEAGKVGLEAQRLDIVKEQLHSQSKKQEVQQERLNLGNDKLQIAAGKVSLDKKSVGLEAQRLGIVNERLKLGADRLGLKEQFLQLMAEGQKLSAREANLGYRIKEFNLHMQQQFINLSSDRLTLQEQQAAFRLDVKHQNNVLTIRKFKLDLLEQSIKDNYHVRMEWLKIQSRENRLDYQDQRRELRVLYDETTRKLGEIRLGKWANELYIKDADVKLQRRQLEFLRKQWLW